MKTKKERNGDQMTKLKSLNNPRKEAGVGVCPLCSVKNDVTATKNRQLIRQVNAQATAIDDLVTELENIKEMLKAYKEEHVKEK